MSIPRVAITACPAQTVGIKAPRAGFAPRYLSCDKSRRCRRIQHTTTRHCGNARPAGVDGDEVRARLWIMARVADLELILAGVEAWNERRGGNPDLSSADLSGANLPGANLSDANLSDANLFRANLSGADLRRAVLSRADLEDADLTDAYLSDADLSDARLFGAFLARATLADADLRDADLRATAFHRADLTRADLTRVRLIGAKLPGAYLTGACLSEADLTGADLTGADLSVANLDRVNFTDANLTGAELYGSDLTGATLVDTIVEQAHFNGVLVYGLSVWGLKGTPAEQRDLIITPADVAAITVDNLKMAQFIYLLLDNPEIREVIDTVARKAVLILGRFTPKRKVILDALRNELRAHDYAPILFDFDKPASRDLTETVRTLAHLARFVVADLTNPKSLPQELQAVVPDLAVPVIPIIQRGHKPYAMFADLRRKYHWVLAVHSYDDHDSLLANLQSAVIEPAEAKAKELGD